MNDKVYVRIVPVNKRAGFHCRRFVYRGVLFKSGEWRLVSQAVADDLATKIQPRSELNPRRLFDIGTREDVEQMLKESEPAPSTRLDGAVDVSDDFRPEPSAAQEEAEEDDLEEPPATPKRRPRK